MCFGYYTLLHIVYYILVEEESRIPSFNIDVLNAYVI